jgi:hypothetical protein
VPEPVAALLGHAGGRGLLVHLYATVLELHTWA